MVNKKHLSDKINYSNYIIKRLFPSKDIELFNDLIRIYNENKEHLYYWHLDNELLDFKNAYDYINYLKNSELFCNVIIMNKKIIGCVEFSELYTDYNSLNFRYITYWLDKDYVRNNIMFNVVNYFLKVSNLLNIDYLIATICDKNFASLKLLDKLGFYIKTRYCGMDVENNISAEVIIDCRKDLSVASEQYMRKFKIRKGMITK